MSEITAQVVLDAARRIMTAVEYCVLSSLGEGKAINARMMQPFPPEDGLTVWLGTGLTARKAQDIIRSSQITLTYMQYEEAAYVTLRGIGDLHADDMVLRRKYWRESWQAFWPDGPEDTNYSLIRFVPLRVEVMDFNIGIAPAPYGLQPAVVARANAETDWEVVSA